MPQFLPLPSNGSAKHFTWKCGKREQWLDLDEVFRYSSYYSFKFVWLSFHNNMVGSGGILPSDSTSCPPSSPRWHPPSSRAYSMQGPTIHWSCFLHLPKPLPFLSRLKSWFTAVTLAIYTVNFTPPHSDIHWADITSANCLPFTLEKLNKQK